MMRRHCVLGLMLGVMLFASAWAEELLLRDKLAQAKEGEFVVTSQQRTQTVLMITAVQEGILYMQEISIPDGCFPANTPSWKAWIEQGAPGHTSWVAYAISQRTGRLLESYSYSKQAWCEGEGTDGFLSTLLNLRLHPLETKYRRRVGSLPGEKADRNGYWQPRLVANGQIVPHAQFQAWHTRWPRDGSELDSKQIELYLPQSEGPFPNYFPYWLQVSGALGKARMRVIDSGTGLHSPRPPMPLRPLAFLTPGKWEEGRLQLWLRKGTYHTDLVLTAIDAKQPARPIPLQFSLQRTEQPDVVLIEVTQEELARRLTDGKAYRFAVQPLRHLTQGAETTEPLTWKSTHERQQNQNPVGDPAAQPPLL